MRAELALGALLAIYIIVVMVVEIVMRYIFNNSIIWVQESVILAFIWIVAFGSSYALMTGSHITIDTFGRFLPEKGQRALRIFVSLVILGCLGYLLIALPPSIGIQNKSKTASLPINFPKGYYYSLPVLVAVIIMIPTQLYYLVYEVGTLFGRTPPDDYRLAPPLSVHDAGAEDGGAA